jgi:Na+/H+ antiporter NhaD/arsenite permease-like protein
MFEVIHLPRILNAAPGFGERCIFYNYRHAGESFVGSIRRRIFGKTRLGAGHFRPCRQSDGRAAILSAKSRRAKFPPGRVQEALLGSTFIATNLARFKLSSEPPPSENLMPRVILYISLVIASVAAMAAGRLAGMLLDGRQIESLGIFLCLILGILLFEDHRLAIALVAVALILVLGLLSVEQFVAAAGLDVILFLLGTFLVAGYLEQSFFFEHLASQIVRHVGPRPGFLLGSLMVSAMIASAVVGEVAAILFVGGAMMQIAARYKVSPLPFLIMLVFAINTGSAASPFGPMGITIALKAHLTVLNFFRWALPISVAVLGLVFVICRWWFAGDWEEFSQAVHREHSNPSVADPIKGRSAAPGWLLVIGMVVLLVLHAQIEQALGLSANSVLLAAALAAGAMALFLSGSGAKELIERRVDWATLAFFLLLFVVVGALQATGVTAAAAQALMHGTGGRPTAIVLAIGWSTGLLSALLANMLAVAAFVPVVASLKAAGANCPTAVYWLMLFGACFMGNMTSIGSTCNIIACGMADKRGHGTIYFRSWLRIGLIVSFASMILATFLLAIQTHGLSR